MFTSSRDSGRRRRSQVYGVNKAARSSKISLLSAFTTASAGSGESTRTVTQDSYTNSKNEAIKRKKHSRRRKTSGSANSYCSSIMEKEKPYSRPLDSSVDVFAFLVEDDNPTVGVNDLDVQSVYDDLPALENQDNGRSFRSPNSDSGISMGESPLHLTRSSSMPEPYLTPLVEDEDDEEDDEKPVTAEAIDINPKQQWKWPKVPQPTHTGFLPSPNEVSNDDNPNTGMSSSIKHKIFSLMKHAQRAKPGPELEAFQPSGYDLVASMLSRTGEDFIPPIFRRFRRVNYRVLLQLQDEITEMEDELALLDLQDSQSRHRSDGSTLPASRRLSWQWNQSDLQSRRLEILGRLYIKVEQYYQALISAQKVRQLTSKARPAEVEIFRRWLKDRTPLSPPESRFLDDDHDLITLEEEAFIGASNFMTQSSLPTSMLLILVLPLLSFKFVLGILDRLILLFMITGVGVLVLQKLGLSRQREDRRFVAFCIGVSGIVALLC